MRNTYRYPALFESCEEGGYTVTFPDLPGVITEGDDLDEAVDMAREALSLHILGMERDGDPIPKATDPATLPKESECVFYSLIEAYLPPLRDKRANRSVNKMVTLPAWLKEESDRRKLNVSQILQHSLIEHLGLSPEKLSREHASPSNIMGSKSRKSTGKTVQPAAVQAGSCYSGAAKALAKSEVVPARKKAK